MRKSTGFKNYRKVNDMEKYTICIGREYGSGGREVGELVAKKLGVTCYDKLLIQEAARKSGMSAGYLERHDETMKDILLPVSGNWFADTADMSGMFYFAGDQAYNAQKQTILSIADRESSVIIGRCASAILDKKPNVLSIFLYGNEADCVARIGSRNGLGEKAARERMEKVNRMRRRYFNFYAMTEWGKPESYDAMLSTSTLGTQGCADAIVYLLEKKLGVKSHD